MSKRGKKIIKANSKIDRFNRFSSVQGLELATSVAFANFDETIDLAVRLGVDPRHADQMVRGTVVLPYGTGKSITVVVFAKGEKEKEALEAGADFVGNDDLIEKIQNGWVNFDRAVATPDMMTIVGKLGRILGPRGLMPNSKSGTVTFDVIRAIKEIKAGKIEFRVDKGGVIHAPIGKVSFGVTKLQVNLEALIEALLRLKPTTSKGTYIKGVVVSTTMGPAVKLDNTEFKIIRT